MVGRLTVCPDGGGVVGGEGREPEDGLPFAGCVRVMREPREVAIAAPALEQRLEREAMKAARACCRNRSFDGQAGELVPERDVPVDGHEHTRGDALVESRVDGTGKRLDQPCLGMRRRDGDGIEHVSCVGRESARSRQNGVANGRGNRRPTRREHLRHEEGIAGGRAMELLGVDPERLGEARDGGGRKG